MPETPDYQRVLKKLLPEGLAWDNLAVDQIAEGMAVERALIHEKIVNTWEVEANPGTAVLYLPEWEETTKPFGDCITPASRSTAQRQAALVDKAFGEKQWRQSIAYFLQLGINQGYADIEIIETDPPLRVGDRVGTRLGGGAAMYSWTVRATGIGAEEDAALECTIRDAARSHYLVHFDFL